MKKVLFILITIVWAALILFLSFQKGPETADTSRKFTQVILDLFYKEDVPYEVLMMWDGKFRLAAHFVLFFLYGIWAVLGIETWSKKIWIAVIIALLTGIGLAIFSEVGKISIEGRHCDFGEMRLNMIGSIAGCVVTACIIQISIWFHRKKKIEDSK